MQFPPGVPDPSEHELRLRATMRVARRRSFMVSAVVVGSLIVLNLFFYARTHNTMWLLLDAVFACTLSYRAWAAFGADKKDDKRIEREVARMQQMMPSRGAGQFPPSGWVGPTAPKQPVPPPPQQNSAPPAPAPTAAPAQTSHDSSRPSDPWSGSWSF